MDVMCGMNGCGDSVHETVMSGQLLAIVPNGLRLNGVFVCTDTLCVNLTP